MRAAEQGERGQVRTTANVLRVARPVVGAAMDQSARETEGGWDG